MTNCIIVDDEYSAIKILKEYVLSTPDLVLVDTFQSPITALKAIREGQIPDILFLDIHMPNFSGLQMTKYLPKSTEVIFTTADSQPAVEAFECNASDYLLKPISYQRFLQSIERFHERQLKTTFNEVNGHFFIQSELKGKLIRINFKDIVFAESLQNYLKIHTVHGDYTTYLQMNELKAKLPGQQFIRVHKSFSINCEMILSVEKNHVNLVGNHTVNIGESYRDILFNRLKKKLIKTSR